MPIITCPACSDEIWRASEADARRALVVHQNRCGATKRVRAAEKGARP